VIVARPIQIKMSPSLTEAAAVLTVCGLPHDDIEPHSLDHFVVARDEHVAVGVAGIQVLGDKALLRSVAVLPSHRSAGIGSRLVAAAEQHARGAGVSEVFLLTNDAQQFFARHGYVELSRCSAPAVVQETAQFGSVCCGAATLMCKAMTATGAKAEDGGVSEIPEVG
jgi:amino-acid N-acetyltransferase